MCSRLTAASVATMLAVILFPATARAEPQALGLVATATPAPLQCAYGVCQAFIGAFCLEERRQPPMKRTLYRPAEGTQITLLAHRPDGSIRRLDGRPWLRFMSNTGYTSVLATIDEDRLAELDAVRLSVEIGPLAVLAPVAVSGDPDRHDAAELDLATGAYRRAAQLHFEADDWRGQAARKAAEMVNALPPFGAVSPERRDGVFAQAIGATALLPEARRELHGMQARCEATIAQSRRMTLRQCLEFEHSVLQTRINGTFWKSLATM